MQLAVYQLIDPVSGFASPEVLQQGLGEVVFARMDGEDLTTTLFVSGTPLCVVVGLPRLLLQLLGQTMQLKGLLSRRGDPAACSSGRQCHASLPTVWHSLSCMTLGASAWTVTPSPGPTKSAKQP